MVYYKEWSQWDYLYNKAILLEKYFLQWSSKFPFAILIIEC